ncbi:hypothetical protein BT63DRAFT_258261 [Microthyrium microscopicum]|uniref:Uncharacterized protein n=1 Tax=Microthyrium microscopicum TaxID=703497 RepID=A0A6A6UCZ3_9PEZI|nr:hypothetical protein BT63DRAFT_258261 [Microthyrium microscopicum]
MIRPRCSLSCRSTQMYINSMLIDLYFSKVLESLPCYVGGLRTGASNGTCAFQVYLSQETTNLETTRRLFRESNTQESQLASRFNNDLGKK